MATQNSFVIEYGLTVGSTEVINSSGKLQASAISELDTDNLSEGSTNQYFTTARVDTHLSNASASKTLSNVQIDAGSIMSSKNFIIKNGLTVGTTEVIDSSGNVTASGVGAAVQEAIADKIGGILVANQYFATATYNDGADTIVIDVPITDEDDMSSNSATAIPSQQSVKAYVDSQILTKDNTDEITEGSTNLYFTNARADARITNALIDEDDMSSNSATKLPSQQSVKAFVETQLATKDALSELSGDTDDITEGSTNLYHTTARVNSAFDTRLATKNTANLTEGSNLYHTTERVQDVVGGQLVTNGSHTGISFSYDDSNDAIDATVSLASFDTDDVSEGSGNLYFTNARADARVSASLPNTDSLGEGSSNLYFTNERVDDRVNALLTAGTGITLSYDDSGNALTISGSAQYGDSDAREQSQLQIQVEMVHFHMIIHQV